MLSGVTQSATKALGGARFSLVNVMPATLLVGFWTVAAAAGLFTGEPRDLSQLLNNLSNPGWAITAIFGVFVLAVILRPFQAALVQFLEGYWPNWRGARLAAELAIERHRRIISTAQVIEDFVEPDTPRDRTFQEAADRQRRQSRLASARTSAATVLLCYPTHRPTEHEEDDHRVMPTLLGNVLRNGEDTAGDRYGLRFEAIAHRLWPNISPKLDAENSRNLDLLDTSAALCICLALAAASSLPFIGNGGLWFLVPLVTALLSAIAYRGAILIARQQGELQATAVDLHRFDMITALHFALPTTPAQERTFNMALSSFFLDREELVKHPLQNHGLTYHHPEPVTPPQVGGGDSVADEDGSGP